MTVLTYPTHETLEDRMIYFNGVDPDVSDYGRLPLPLPELFSQLELPTSPDKLTDRDLVAWEDANDLSRAGWGLIVHEREDPIVVEALTPLIRYRRSECGERFKLFDYHEADCASPESFFLRHGFTRDDVDPVARPYYLLIVGPPTRISFEFQFALSRNHAVGRLSFQQPEAYFLYANNVLASERGLAPLRPKQMVLFGAENDVLTELSSNHLVKPLAEKLKQTDTDWRIQTWTGEEARCARLKKLIGGIQTPPLLFTAGHGVCFGHNMIRREREQGGLVASDWSGPGTILQREHFFTADDVPDGADFRGTINFHFACFSGGTPEFSPFTKQGVTQRFHTHPFTAPLPERLLGHPRGALAVIGHVDQAFQYSFLWDDRIREVNHFASTLYNLTRGCPIGAAMAPMNRRFANVAAEIAREMMLRGPSQDIRLRYWLGYYDARGYIVLGDPAVRLQQPKYDS